MILQLKRDGEAGYLNRRTIGKKISGITEGLRYQQLNGTDNLLQGRILIFATNWEV